jgi:hypothetical protein
MTQLMDLQERWEKNEARKAFVAAMNEFKKNPPRIEKNQRVEVTFKDNKGKATYNHATLDHVCDAVIESLGKHGLSHRWSFAQEKEWIKVTCAITHALGHSEETTLMGVADTSGSKNSIQAIASTVTYLERYTLLAACGLAAANSDNDGRGAGAAANAIPDERVMEFCDRLDHAADMEQLREIFRAAYCEADQAKDRAAMSAYIRAKDARKAELQ